MSLAKLARKILMKSTPRSKKRAELEKKFKSEKKGLDKYEDNKKKLNEDAETFARRELAKEVGAKSYLEKTNVAKRMTDSKFETKGKTKGQIALPSLRRRATEQEGVGKAKYRKMASVDFPSKTLERNLGIPAQKNESLTQYAKRIRNRLGPSGKKVLDDALKKRDTPNVRQQKLASRRAMGERAVGKAIKAAVGSRVRTAAGVAGGTAGAVGLKTAGAPGKDKDKNKDARINPKDYPTYGKKTLSAKAFRKKYNEAKANKQKTFRFEGRVYIVSAVKKQI